MNLFKLAGKKSTSLICIIVFLQFEYMRGTINIFFLFQLYSAHIDIAIANYCTINKKLNFYMNKDEGMLYFLEI